MSQFNQNDWMDITGRSNPQFSPETPKSRNPFMYSGVGSNFDSLMNLGSGQSRFGQSIASTGGGAAAPSVSGNLTSGRQGSPLQGQGSLGAPIGGQGSPTPQRAEFTVTPEMIENAHSPAVLIQFLDRLSLLDNTPAKREMERFITRRIRKLEEDDRRTASQEASARRREGVERRETETDYRRWVRWKEERAVQQGTNPDPSQLTMDAYKDAMQTTEKYEFAQWKSIQARRAARTPQPGMAFGLGNQTGAAAAQNAAQEADQARRRNQGLSVTDFDRAEAQRLGLPLPPDDARAPRPPFGTPGGRQIPGVYPGTTSEYNAERQMDANEVAAAQTPEGQQFRAELNRLSNLIADNPVLDTDAKMWLMREFREGRITMQDIFRFLEPTVGRTPTTRLNAMQAKDALAKHRAQQDEMVRGQLGEVRWQSSHDAALQALYNGEITQEDFERYTQGLYNPQP